MKAREMKGRDMKGSAVGDESSSSMTGRVRNLVGVLGRVRALEARVATLEASQVRMAELLDLTQELLLPVAVQDEEKVRTLVERYTDELDSGRRGTS